MSSFRNLKSLGIAERVQLESMALTDFRSVFQVLMKFQPDEVYNLANYVIASGESCDLEDFVAAAFAAVNLDWREHVAIDNSLLKPTDLAVGRGNPRKAEEIIGWKAKYKMTDVVRMMSAAKA